MNSSRPQTPDFPGTVHSSPRVHVIIVLGGGPQPWIETCLGAVMAQTLPPWRVTVFDNGKQQDVADCVAHAFPAVRLMRSPRNLGVAGGCNRAAASILDVDYILLLDPAAILAMQALERLTEIFATYPEIGILGSKVLDRDVETIRHVGVALSENAIPIELGRGEPERGQYRGVREVPAVQGAGMTVRQEVWRELGGLDERFRPAGYECLDCCLRARALSRLVAIDCDTFITHFDPWAPRRTDREGLRIFFRNRARFLLKHYGGRDWLRRYLPGELRWLTDLQSKGMRTMALGALWRAALGWDRDPEEPR